MFYSVLAYLFWEICGILWYSGDNWWAITIYIADNICIYFVGFVQFIYVVSNDLGLQIKTQVLADG